MNRTTELELIDELLALEETRTPFLRGEESASPVSRYTSPERFELERTKILRRMPQFVAQADELPEPNSFVRRDVAGAPLILTRDEDGEVHAFLNACRHRGAQLVSDSSGCQRRFACPYHAWTYDTSGRLVGVPHQKTGFPTLDRNGIKLAEVGCREAYGMIWVSVDGNAIEHLDDYLGEYTADLEMLDLGSLTPFATAEQRRRANWKIIVEGGIESYHFKVAHRNTVGRLFEDNLSTYRTNGPNLRSVLARNTIAELRARPREEWRIRDVTNLLYTFMPASQLLVQADHIIAIHMNPIAHDDAMLRMTTLVPKESAEKRAEYWQANHDFTIETLNEDFDLGEGIQKSLESGANETLRFGRFESALAHFNDEVDARADG